MTTTQPSRQWIAPAVFLYGTLVASFVCFVVFRRQGMVDASLVDLNGFGAIARHIVHGEGFTLGLGPTIRRAPLYPYLGAALVALFSHDAPGISQLDLYRPILVANCVFFGLTCVMVWAIASRLFGARVGLLAAAICPLAPQCLRYVGMTEVETIMGLFIATLAWTGLSLATRPSIRYACAFGLTAGAATLTKPIVLVYPFVFLALAAWHWNKAGTPRRQQLLAAGAALACFIALLVPWSLRNMSVTDGQFKGISSNGPGEFLRGYINVQPKYFLLRQDFGGGGSGEKWDPEANQYESGLLLAHGMPFYRYIEDASGKSILQPPPPPGTTNASLLDAEKDRIESAEVKRKVLADPGAFVGKFLIQVVTFWYVVETRAKSMMVGAISFIVLAFATAGFFRARREQRMVWPVVATIGYFNVIYAIFLAFARYSMPLFPVLMALSAGGVAAVAERLWKRPSMQSGRSREAA